MSKTLVIGVSAAVVGLFALGGFLLWQAGLGGLGPSSATPPPPAPAPSPQSQEQSIIDTSDWQTYRSDELGFEFQYPSSLEIGTEEGEEVLGFTCFNLELTSVRQAVDYQNFAIHIDCPGRGLGEKNPDEYNIDGRKANSYNFEYENVDYKDILVVLFVDEHTYNFTSNKVSDQRDEALFQEILSTFRFVGEEGEDLALVCESNNAKLIDTKTLQFDADPDPETFTVCQSGSGRFAWATFFVFDDRDSSNQELWKGTASFTNLGYPPAYDIVDVDEDGVHEIYQSSNSCGGSCTGCSTNFVLYSPKYKETFSRLERTEFDASCTDFIDLPTQYSPNLEQPEFHIFKEYLDGANFSPV